jgi:general secretion pathway protein G
MRNSDDGYTLTEMLVVLAIIGLLAAALTPVLAGQLSRARAKSARLQVESVATSLESFRADVGRYPTKEEGLIALLRQPTDAEGWLGPYIKGEKGVTDPWGRALAYEISEDAEPRVVSLGADGRPGGASVAADIASQ